MLIGNKENSCGLSQSALANAMQKYLDGLGLTVNDCYQTIRNYLKGNRAPQNAYAWALGEGLREVGIPWMNGYCMLWSAGAYEEALATTFEYVVQRRNILDSDDTNMLWFGAMAGMQLAQYRSTFDFEPDILAHTMRDTGLSAKTDAILASKVAAPSPDSLTVGSSEFDSDAYERNRQAMTVTMRDLAMAHWHGVVPFMKPLKAAYIAACIQTNAYLPRHATVPNDVWGAHSVADTIVVAAMDLARSSNMPLYSLETSLLIVLGQYLNMLDPALNDGGRSLHYLPRWSAF
jgi:hypothetical protein